MTDLFIDSSLKICNDNYDEYDKFLDEVAAISDKIGINIVTTASMPADKASDTVKKYL